MKKRAVIQKPPEVQDWSRADARPVWLLRPREAHVRPQDAPRRIAEQTDAECPAADLDASEWVSRRTLAEMLGFQKNREAARLARAAGVESRRSHETGEMRYCLADIECVVLEIASRLARSLSIRLS